VAGPDLPELRTLMSDVVGLVRSGGELEGLAGVLRDVVGQDPDAADDATLVALLVTQSALQRRESRGGHVRTDHPAPDPAPRHTTISLSTALAGTPTRPAMPTHEPSLIGAVR